MKFKLSTTIEIEIDIEAKTLDAANKIADKIEVSVNLDKLPKKLDEHDVYISSVENGIDWSVTED